MKITSTAKPNDYPNLSYGALWYHQSENLIYSSFSGAVAAVGGADTTPPLTFWAFKPDKTGGGTFDTIFDSDSSTWATSDLTRPYFALQASGPDKALILGGLDEARSMELPGLVQFDMNTRSFTNRSSASIGQPVFSGQMQYVPSFGPDGIFLAFGGESKEQGLASFDMVPVFDPAAQTWYNQTTSGNTPKGRRDFCVAGIASTNDTYEIFLYGGLGGSFDASDGMKWNNTPYDTVSILTLPAFHWVDVTYDGPVPRNLHTCDSVGGSQILIFGGTDYVPSKGTGDTQNSMSTKDPWSQGIGIFDLSNLEWADHHSAHSAPYEQSDPVKQHYAESGQSYISDLDSSVATLMKTTHFNHTVADSPTNSINTSNSTVALSKSTNTGAIAGGVVGGIAALCIIAAIVFFTLRRRRRLAGRRAELDSKALPPYAAAEKQHEMDSESPNPELPSNQMMRAELPEQHLLELGQERREARHELQS